MNDTYGNMSFLTVRHLTVYRYSEPVGLGEHRMMFRPRESHDLRLHQDRVWRLRPLRLACAGCTMCSITPSPSPLSMATTSELRFDSTVTLEHFETALPEYPLEEYAKTYPFRYSDDELPEPRARSGPSLSRAMTVRRWVKQFLDPSGHQPPEP